MVNYKIWIKRHFEQATQLANTAVQFGNDVWSVGKKVSAKACDAYDLLNEGESNWTNEQMEQWCAQYAKNRKYKRKHPNSPMGFVDQFKAAHHEVMSWGDLVEDTRRLRKGASKVKNDTKSLIASVQGKQKDSEPYSSGPLDSSVQVKNPTLNVPSIASESNSQEGPPLKKQKAVKKKKKGPKFKSF